MDTFKIIIRERNEWGSMSERVVLFLQHSTKEVPEIVLTELAKAASSLRQGEKVSLVRIKDGGIEE